MERRIVLSQASKNKIEKLLPYLILLPVLICVIVFLIYPFVYGIRISFTDKKIGTQPHFIGLKNYIDLLKDKVFLESVRNTFVYTFFSVMLKVIIGMIMAVVLDSKIKCKNIARSILLIPWAVPTTVALYVWQWMFADSGGILNAILLKTGIVSSKVAFLSKPWLAMASVVLVNVWRGSPFIGISVLAGMQTIPQDLYDSAVVDGANSIQQFVYITLPSVRDVLTLATLVTTIWTFNDFEIIWLLTRGGPINATQVISTFSYKMGIMNMEFAKSISASILFLPFVILLVNYITGLTLGKQRRKSK